MRFRNNLRFYKNVIFQPVLQMHKNIHFHLIRSDHTIKYRHNFYVSSFTKYFSEKFHVSAFLYVKSFQEKENEFAHSIMENIPAYVGSLLKQPLEVDSFKYPKELKDFEKKKEQGDYSHPEEFLVFVYGTLKTNEPNYDQMINTLNGQATFFSLGRTVQKWPLVIASRFNIPFLLFKEGVGKNIIGEIFKVDKAMLSHMDAFENHPTYYTRLQVEVELLNKVNSAEQSVPEIVTPWVYFLKTFRSDLLQLPFLENYSSKGPHGLEYITRYNRPEGQDYYSDVKM